MLNVIKWAAVFVCVSVTGYTVYDYSATKMQNAELTAANTALHEANKSVEDLLRKIDVINEKVDQSLVRVHAQSIQLDKVAYDIRRSGAEAKKHDETYRVFVATPIHDTSLRMFNQARNTDIQDEKHTKSAVDPTEGHTSSTGVKTR